MSGTCIKSMYEDLIKKEFLYLLVRVQPHPSFQPRHCPCCLCGQGSLAEPDSHTKSAFRVRVWLRETTLTAQATWAMAGLKTWVGLDTY